MNWFGGNIPDAIQKSKQKKVVFIVYIYGEDEISKKMDKVWEDKSLISTIEESGSIAIKIAAKSETCGHFSQIYPVVVVPSTYFIGVKGVPIEVTAGSVDASSFQKTVQNVLKIHTEQLGGPVSQSSSSASGGSDETQHSKQQPVPQSSPSASGDEVQHSKQQPSSSGTVDKPPLEERIKRAKEKIEEKKEEKLKVEEMKERNEEIERRKLGKDVQKLKGFQKERELKETLEQFRKEKADEKQQRQKIKEQIARDREERANRFKKEKDEQNKTKEEIKQAKLAAQQKASQETEAKKLETARIQIRLPDGSSISNTFPSSDTLQSVDSLVTQHIGSAVTLSQVYPKRTFTADDLQQSLLSLQLAPSAVLIAVPATKSVISKPNDNSGGLVAMLLAPFILIWNLISSLLFGGSNSPQPPPPSTETRSTQPVQSSSGARPKSAYQRRPIHAEGNIRRLQDTRDDDDDENATWNGNSTQQM